MMAFYVLFCRLSSDFCLKLSKNFKLTPALAGLDYEVAYEWSLWGPLSFNFIFLSFFLNFWPRMTLNNLDKNFFIKPLGRFVKFVVKKVSAIILNSEKILISIVGVQIKLRIKRKNMHSLQRYSFPKYQIYEIWS